MSLLQTKPARKWMNHRSPTKRAVPVQPLASGTRSQSNAHSSESSASSQQPDYQRNQGESNTNGDTGPSIDADSNASAVVQMMMTRKLEIPSHPAMSWVTIWFFDKQTVTNSGIAAIKRDAIMHRTTATATAMAMELTTIKNTTTTRPC